MQSPLTLKNIYRLLTVQDYPVFGPAIFAPAELKGLTLYRFWDSVLIEDLRSGRTGSMLWRQTGSRNRNLSSICNSSCSAGVYKRYLAEIMEEMKPALFQRQAESFLLFFQSRRTDALVLQEKLAAFHRLLCREGRAFSVDAERWLDACLSLAEDHASPGSQEMLFCHSLYLSLLTLLCLAGPESSRPDFQSVFTLPEYKPERVFLLHTGSRESTLGNDRFRILTDQKNVPVGFGIPKAHFFGRENELFELRETLRLEKNNYLISGPAGVGKTELLYQLINVCQSEDLPFSVAFIYYTNDLEDSLLRSFPQIRSTDKASRLLLIHQYLQKESQRDLLLCIDNLQKNKADTEELSILRSLGCRIYATSRAAAIEGFTSFPLQSLRADSCFLLFRDIYASPLSRDEIHTLQSLFIEKDLMHTLTVRLLASAANQHRWTPEHLPAVFAQQDLSLLETAPGSSMRSIYRRLFQSGSPTEETRHLMILAAHLPVHPVAKDVFLSWICPENTTEAQKIQSTLEVLIAQGWIREDARGISVHPLIRSTFSGGSLGWLENSPILPALLDGWQRTGGYPAAANIMLPSLSRPSQIDLADFLYAIAVHMKDPLPSVLADVLTEALLLRVMMYQSTGDDLLLERMSQQQDLSEKQRLRLLCIYLSLRILPDALSGFAEGMRTRLMSGPQSWDPEEELFLCLYGKYLGYSNDSRTPLLLEPLAARTSEPSIRAMCCIVLSACALFAMDAERMQTWLMRAEECIRENGLEGTHLHLAWLEGNCNFLQATMQANALLEAARELQGLGKSLGSKNAEWMAMYYQGSLLIHDPAEVREGVKLLEESRNLAMAVEKSDFAALFLNKHLAMGYEKEEQFEQSEAIYLESIALLQKYPQRILDLQQYENNLGVLYQHWGKWDKSLPLLESALEKAIKFNSAISIAEPRNNLSKYYRHIGNFEMEKALLTEVVPVFQEVYGPKHPKTMDAEQRLANPDV